MANYKKGKCRFHGKHKGSRAAFMRKRCGVKPIKLARGWWKEREPGVDYWPAWFRFGHMGCYPRAWDIQFHTRPRRRAEARCLNAIKQGSDPDNIAWPLEKKPHIYYY